MDTDQILETLPFGYSACRILPGVNGEGYRFLLAKVNHSFEELFKIELSRFSESGQVELFSSHSTSFQEVYFHLVETIEEKEQQTFDFYWKEKNRWVEIKSHLASDDLIISLYTDISERKKTEQELKESKALLHSLLDSMPINIFSKDREGRFTYINKYICDTEERTPDSMVGKTDWELYPEELARQYTNDDKRVMKGEIISRDEEHHPLGLEKTYVHVLKAPLYEWEDSQKINGVLGLYWDITAQKKDEEEQKKLREQLHISQKMDAVGQLAGGMAHDFNNMLGGILSAADIIESRSNDTSILPFAELIISVAQKASGLTRQLLAFARKDSTQKQVILADDIFQETITLLGHTLDKSILIEYENKAPNAALLIDPATFQNALVNMGLNAGHAMPDGGVLSFQTNRISLDHNFCHNSPFELVPGDYIEIKVSDTGHGIDADTKQRIFEPFFTTKPIGKGTGLGLSVVYGMIKEIKGDIRVYSEEKRGTCFHLYLPLIEYTGEKVSSSKQFTKEDFKAEGVILIADDEEYMRFTLINILTDYGFSVIPAANGEEAFRKFRENRKSIDLVILDMMMPVMGGEEAFSLIRSVDNKIPIIISSGFADPARMEEVKKLGPNGFISKPFRAGTLWEELKKIPELKRI